MRIVAIAAAILVGTALTGCKTLEAILNPPGSPAEEAARQLTAKREKLSREEAISHYFGSKSLKPIEGMWIWANSDYEVAIVDDPVLRAPLQRKYDYFGVLVVNNASNQAIGTAKMYLNETAAEDVYSMIYSMANGALYGTTAVMDGNILNFQIPGDFGPQRISLIRTYPKGGSAKKGGISSGTGFFIGEDIIATNFHVVDSASRITVHAGSKEYSGVVLVKDTANDLALIKINIPSNERGNRDIYRPLKLGDIKGVKQGQKVRTMGFPLPEELGVSPRLSEGSVNSLVGLSDDPRLIQIDIPIQPGNSGGALVDERGLVVGIVTSSLNNEYLFKKSGSLGQLSQNVNFAVKVEYLRNLAGTLPEGSVSAPDRATVDSESAIAKATVRVSAR